MKRLILILLALILLTVFAFSGYKLYQKMHSYEVAEELYAELQDKYVMTVPPTEAKPTEQPTQESQADVAEPLPLAPEHTPEPPPILVDFATLQADNSDVVGWIYSPDTPMNYPVVQAKDNKTYLRRDFYGDYLYSGSIFVDSRNRPITEELNFLIYGHNMKDQSMFGSLPNYQRQAYYEAHSELFYLTPQRNYRLEPLAGLVVDTKDMIFQTTPDEEEFAQHIEACIAKSSFQSNAIFEKGDQIVTLSTCSYEFKNARYVLICKLTPL